VSARILRTKAVGVVVPVHNEAALLGDALDALKVAFTHLRNTGIPSLLTLVFDSCDDKSVDVARQWTRGLSGRTALSVSAIISDARNVGVARSVGCAATLDHFHDQSPEHVWIATTDADSRVPRTWISEQIRHHEKGIDAWAGRVSLDGEGTRSDTLRRWQRAYDREIDPVHGASLGFNGAKYLAVGGFSPLETGEDRALLSALAASRATTHFDSSLRVLTSMRNQGRAPHGFAEAIHGFDSWLGAIAD
jgi:glycosyltransferase involved in cell wall biosynthesis